MADEKCLFCRIVTGKIPVRVVFEDEQCVGFRDINPQAPLHALVIPRRHVQSLDDLAAEDEALVGHLQLVAATIARAEGYVKEGYRTVINTGAGAGQSVFHLHVHVLAGRLLNWPPG